MNIALNNPVLFSCIEIRAKALSKVRFYQEDKNGEEIQDSKIVELLNNPNHLQSKEDFLKQYEWFKSVYGWVYQKPYFTSVDKKVKHIFNLQSNFIEFPLKMKSSILFTEKDVRDYERQTIQYKELDQAVKKIEIKELMKFYDITNSLTEKSNSSITSPSRVHTIIKNISNINLSTNSENIMIQQNGREMFYGITGSGSGLGSSLPMAKGDNENIKKVINNTGLGNNKQRAIITNREIGHKSLHSKLKELGLSEVITNNAELVRSVFEVPSEVYDAFTKGKTYENQKEATIGFYQNTMQPIADDLANTYTSDFDLEFPLKASFDHLPVMQHTEDKKADKILKISMAYEKLQRAGMSENDINDLFISQGLNSMNNEK